MHQDNREEQINNWKYLYKLLKEDVQLFTFVKLVSMSEVSFTVKNPIDFSTSDVHQIILQNMKNMKLTNLKKAIARIPRLPSITAKIIKCTKSFTLALLIVPPGFIFNWHSHQNMNGMSICILGNLRIRSLKIDTFRESCQKSSVEKSQSIFYPKQQMRVQQLLPNDQSISIIYPDTYNIHEIQGSCDEQSVFIDLLIPEYPDGNCSFYSTIAENQLGVYLKEVHLDRDNIISLDQYVRQVMKIKQQ